MKTSRKNRQWTVCLLSLASMAAAVLAGCSSREAALPPGSAENVVALAPDPLAIVLAPHEGAGKIDDQIRRMQAEVRANRNPGPALDQLGWLYVAKARQTFDAGYYTLAEQCALALDHRETNGAAGLLLRGHASHSQHRFGEAEALARQLVEIRGLAIDFGLLGDILMDRGRVDEAARAYQSMLDLKPDPQGYARAAHYRWLTGDPGGAIEVMHMAANGSSPGDPDTAAWMQTQLARYCWYSGADSDASDAVAAALGFRAEYPPALLLRGRMLMAAGHPGDAIQSLEPAAAANPLPEYQWALAEAYRASERTSDAGRIEREILERGPAVDPRTCALFLATRQEQVELAVRLARDELSLRADVYSHDTLAVALLAAGLMAEANSEMEEALVGGTPDPRLWLHAGAIAARNSRGAVAAAWFRKAAGRALPLLPSERDWLRREQACLAAAAAATPANLHPAPPDDFSARIHSEPVAKE